MSEFDEFLARTEAMLHAARSKASNLRRSAPPVPGRSADRLIDAVLMRWIQQRLARLVESYEKP